MMPISIDLETDRFIRTTQIEHRVVFSLMHLRRLEKDGLFPRRISLSGRAVGWSLRDVLRWMQEKLDERPGGLSFARTIIYPGDRFISAKEACSMVGLSKHQIDRLESQGAFPRRAQIGGQRVAWLERDVQNWIDEVKIRSIIHFDELLAS
jgi:prophage regulatory protein